MSDSNEMLVVFIVDLKGIKKNEEWRWTEAKEEDREGSKRWSSALDFLSSVFLLMINWSYRFRRNCLYLDVIYNKQCLNRWESQKKRQKEGLQVVPKARWTKSQKLTFVANMNSSLGLLAYSYDYILSGNNHFNMFWTWSRTSRWTSFFLFFSHPVIHSSLISFLIKTLSFWW